MIMLKTNNELKIMREANRIIAIILSEIEGKIKPGTNTYELDHWAERRILSLKGKPAFKGYGGKGKPYPFPATLCTSINNEVVHGIPSKTRILEEGEPCSRSKRKSGTLEKQLRIRGRMIKIVIVESITRWNNETVWLITHVGD